MWDLWVIDSVIGEAYRIECAVSSDVLQELRLIWNVEGAILFTVPVGFLAVRDPLHCDDISASFEDCRR